MEVSKTGKFPAIERLKGRGNFALFYRKKRLYGKHFTVTFITEADIPQGNTGRRVAFIVSKKCEKSSVIRHQIKRRVRELYRIYRTLLPDNVWLLIIANAAACGSSVTFQHMEEDVVTLFKKISSYSCGDHVNKTI